MVNPLFKFKQDDRTLKDTYILIKWDKEHFRISWIYYGGVLQGLRKSIYIKHNDQDAGTIKRIFKQMKELVLSK